MELKKLAGKIIVGSALITTGLLGGVSLGNDAAAAQYEAVEGDPHSIKITTPTETIVPIVQIQAELDAVQAEKARATEQYNAIVASYDAKIAELEKIISEASKLGIE